MERLIIFPTDTVYGIGASVFDKESIDKIYKIKKRPFNKPLAVLCANLEQIEEIANLNSYARILINKFLPGPLTIIVDAKENIRKSMNLEMVGVRIPNSKIALDILNKMGPLATTSVNDSGATPLNEYEEIVDKYSNLVDRIYQSNEISSNISSTVVMIHDDDIKLIREGEISFSDILKYK
ncbi:MAG: L-threonylcarbamoyladenylate synthase [Anaeroplasmataceae bacterium]